MRIERIELRLLRLPLVRFFETSFGRIHERPFILVVVEGDGPPAFHVGIEWVAVVACLAITAWRKNLLLGLVAAVAIVAVARATGLAAIPI